MGTFLLSVVSLSSQGQEQEAGPDKALGMVQLGDAFVVQMGKAEAQRGTEAFPETHKARAQYHLEPLPLGAPIKKSCSWIVQ